MQVELRQLLCKSEQAFCPHALSVQVAAVEQVRLLSMDTTDVSSLLRDWPAACQRALQDWGTTQKEVAEHSEHFRKRRVADNEVCQLLVIQIQE